MVDDIKFVTSASELDNMVFDRKTVLVMMLSADIDNENGRPVYEVNYAIGLIDKATNGRYGQSAVVEESCLYYHNYNTTYNNRIGLCVW